MRIFYRQVPAMQSVFKVVEDCCYEKVVYGGIIRGITAKNDDDSDVLNSWNLICDICDPNLLVLSISKKEYEAKKQEVIEKLKMGFS